MNRAFLSALVIFSVSALASASVIKVSCEDAANPTKFRLWGEFDLNPGHVVGVVHSVSDGAPERISPMVGTYLPASKWSPEHVNLTLNFPDTKVQKLNAYQGDTSSKHQSTALLKGGEREDLVCSLTIQ